MIRSKNRGSKLFRGHLSLLLFMAIYFFVPSSLFAAQDRVEFVSDSAIHLIKLPHGNIFEGSIAIQSPTGPIDLGGFERIDYSAGILYFAGSQRLPSPLIITYEYLVYELPEYFARRKLDLDVTPRINRQGLVQPEFAMQQEAGGAQSFRISGSKGIGVSIGNMRDFELDQSLNLQIRGEPTKGILVAGSLSDKAQPQIGGISSSLEEIESISLKASGSHFSLELGDLDYRNGWGNTVLLAKRLKGADLQINSNLMATHVTAAGLKSKYKTIAIAGVDGLAGPYHLSSESGGRAVIIAGSERVYLDGQLLKAGAAEDYQIDYALGQLTFNPRISLTSRSRIVVDYEYLDQSYRRNLYSAELQYKGFTQALNLAVGFIDLTDSKDNPVEFANSPEASAILREAGDDQNKAVKDGGIYVGMGNGNYQKKTDSLGQSFYQYAGINLGDYTVTFTQVGRNQGDYSYIGSGVYVYKGHNQGDYLPLIYLPMPEQTQAIYANADGRISNLCEMHLKLSGSDHDVNLFSNLEDSDNQGFRGDAVISIPSLADSAQRGFFRFSQTKLRLGTEERTFYLPGRSDSVELDRKWALQSNSIYQRADQIELSENLRFGRSLGAVGEWGKYRDGDFIAADRYLTGVKANPLSCLELGFRRTDRSSRRDSAAFSGRLYQDRAEIILKAGKWAMTSFWDNEKNIYADSLNSPSPSKFNRLSCEAEYNFIKLGISRRQEWRLGNDWQKEFNDYIISSSLRQAFSGGRYQFESELLRRVVDYNDNLKPDLRETKALSRFSFADSRSILSGSVSYRLNRQAVVRLNRSFVKVEQGQGDYRLEDSVYVPDPFGDWVALDEPGETGESGLASERSCNLRVDFAKLMRNKKGLSTLTSETSFNLEEKGDDNFRLNLLYLWPSWRVYPNARLFSKLDLRQVFNLTTRSGQALALGWEENQAADNLSNLRSDSYRRTIYERISLSLERNLGLKAEHRFKKERVSSGFFGAANYREHEVLLELAVYSGRNFEIKMAPRYLNDHSLNDDLKITLWGGQIMPSLGLAEKGRITVEWSYYRVNNTQGQSVPFQFAAGNRPGDNLRWSAGLNLKYSQNITVQIKYSADKVPGLSVRQQANLSMRANF